MKLNLLNCKGTPGKMPNERSTMVKTRLKRIFERQFQSSSKINAVESPDPSPLAESGSKAAKVPVASSKAAEVPVARSHVENGYVDHEPSSVCLTEMVHDFMENGEKASDCGCNCLSGHFNGDRNNPDNEDDRKSSLTSGELCEILKSLVPCPSVQERNLLADTSKAVEEVNEEGNSLCKDKDVCTNGCLRRAVITKLKAMGYNAAMCRAQWDQANGYPSGEYEYIDVLDGGKGKAERLIVDIDFRSQFEIARSTSHYTAVLQMLPVIFVGRVDRLQQIISIVCDAARQSLKKKHLHIPPWRRVEYMQAKWTSPSVRETNEDEETPNPDPEKIDPATEKKAVLGNEINSDKSAVPGKDVTSEKSAALGKDVTSEKSAVSGKDLTLEKSAVSGKDVTLEKTVVPEMEVTSEKNDVPEKKVTSIAVKGSGWGARFTSEFELKFRGGNSVLNQPFKDSGGGKSTTAVTESLAHRNTGDQITVVVSEWQPPAVKPKTVQRGRKIGAGLASMLREAGLSSKS